MLDLDHFKQINDLLGHEAGDRALVAFANLVQSSKRPNDVFGRVGGVEFALFLPEASASVAREVAARIVRECQALVPDGQPPKRLSVSIGLASINRSDRDRKSVV